MKRLFIGVASIPVLTLTVSLALFPMTIAEGVRLKGQVFSSGGCIGATSTGYIMHGTAVQAVLGKSTGGAFVLGHGFWTFRPSLNCCVGRVGDANGSGDDEPSIGDVSVMIDAKFITGTCDGIISCLAEADINQSGGTNPTCDDITIGDISTLIDYLFITGSSLGLLECL